MNKVQKYQPFNLILLSFLCVLLKIWRGLSAGAYLLTLYLSSCKSPMTEARMILFLERHWVTCMWAWKGGSQNQIGSSQPITTLLFHVTKAKTALEGVAKEGLRTTVRKSRSFPLLYHPISGQARKRRYARNLEKRREADLRLKHWKTRGWTEENPVGSTQRRKVSQDGPCQWEAGTTGRGPSVACLQE